MHLNSQFGAGRPTDHDPQLALLTLGRGATSAVTMGEAHASFENDTGFDFAPLAPMVTTADDSGWWMPADVVPLWSTAGWTRPIRIRR